MKSMRIMVGGNTVDMLIYCVTCKYYSENQSFQLYQKVLILSFLNHIDVFMINNLARIAEIVANAGARKGWTILKFQHLLVTKDRFCTIQVQGTSFESEFHKKKIS